MTSSRPYLLRAIYEWIVDNGLTPYLLVNANVENVMVPTEYVSNGKIILNVAPAAVNDLEIENDEVHFNARFSGNPMYVCVPMSATMAIYAKENGRGMVFREEEPENEPPPGPGDKALDRPTLRIVK